MNFINLVLKEFKTATPNPIINTKNNHYFYNYYFKIKIFFNEFDYLDVTVKIKSIKKYF